MHKIHETNGTVLELGEKNPEIVMRIAYHDSPAEVFLGYKLYQKLGLEQTLSLFGYRFEYKTKDEPMTPGVLYCSYNQNKDKWHCEVLSEDEKITHLYVSDTRDNALILALASIA